MHIFSLAPTFAMNSSEDNLNNQNVAESPVLDYNKSIETNDPAKNSIEKSEKKYVDKKIEDIALDDTDNTKNKLEDKNKIDCQTENEKEVFNKEENKDIVAEDIADAYSEKDIGIIDNYTLSNDSTLKSLSFYITNGGLTEPFNPNKKEYIALINGNSTTFRLGNDTIRTNSSVASMNIYYNDDLVFENVTGTTDRTFTLVKGQSNILKILVTAENGEQSTYTVAFEREGSNDTRLELLGFYGSLSTLTEPFSPEKKDYTAILKGNENTFRFVESHKPSNSRVKDPYATMDIYYNDELVFKNITGTTDKTFTLLKGQVSVLKIVVTSENGNQSTYTVTFKREGSSDTGLGLLGFYGGIDAFTEPYTPEKKDYVAIIKGNSNTFKFVEGNSSCNTRVRDPYATMDVYFNDDLIFENITKTPDKVLELVKNKVNIMKVVVTAENGNQDTYTITFKREGSSDARLGLLGFYNSAAAFTEPFDPDKKDYVAIVKGNSNSFKFVEGHTSSNTRVRDPYATMDVYFNDDLIFKNITKTPDKTLELVKDKINILKVVVTSENGNQLTYTITFEREGYRDTGLNLLGFYDSSRILTESFNTDKKDYIGVIKGSSNSFKFIEGHTSSNTRVKDPYATMDVFFNDELIFKDIKITPDKTLELVKNKVNVLKIIVTSESGDQSTYTVTFERENDSNVNIKSFSLNKGSFEFKEDEGIFKVTLDSWKDISVSKLALEDNWADYKLILNNVKEVTINENFDLGIGDNKLDIEVTSNNGTKKTYPVIFERTDNTNPTVNHTKDKEDWTKENVLIKIDATDDSGIRYIELPNGEKVYSNKTEFYASQNGTYKFKVYDNLLNETVETVNVSNIDKELPELTLKASTTELTNDSVDILIEASDNVGIKYIETPDGQLVTKNNLTYEVYEDGKYTFKVVDLAGNETIKSITLNNIDSVNPVLATELSNDDWSNEELVLSVFAMSDKGIKYIELPDGSKVENNFAEYGIKENGTYFIATESLGGNITSEKVIINNIDTELPTLNLTNSTEDWTNEDVEIYISTEDNVGIDYIILPNGDTVCELDYTYIVDSNGTYEFAVVDLAGNKTTESIEIKNIDKNPPIIENYDELVAILNNIITLDLSRVKTPSGIHKVILPNKEEVVEPVDDIIEYEVKYNDTYTFTVVDRAGNSVDVDVKVDTLIDKEDDSLVNKIDSLIDSLPNTGGIYSVVLFTSIGLILGGAVTLIRIRKK